MTRALGTGWLWAAMLDDSIENVFSQRRDEVEVLAFPLKQPEMFNW